jgi:hypothetical protein
LAASPSNLLLLSLVDKGGVRFDLWLRQRHPGQHRAHPQLCLIESRWVAGVVTAGTNSSAVSITKPDPQIDALVNPSVTGPSLG